MVYRTQTEAMYRPINQINSLILIDHCDVNKELVINLSDLRLSVIGSHCSDAFWSVRVIPTFTSLNDLDIDISIHFLAPKTPGHSASIPSCNWGHRVACKVASLSRLSSHREKMVIRGISECGPGKMNMEVKKKWGSYRKLTKYLINQ